jgi:ketosteroid isomerase-like protein
LAEQEGVQKAREYIDAFHNWDVDRMRDFYSDDIVWHVAGTHPLSGDYRGKDALFDYFTKVREMTGGSLRLEPESILASDRHTAFFTRITAERDGSSLDTLLAQVMRVGPDGRWTEYWAVSNDQDAVDRFWS